MIALVFVLLLGPTDLQFTRDTRDPNIMWIHGSPAEVTAFMLCYFREYEDATRHQDKARWEIRRDADIKRAAMERAAEGWQVICTIDPIAWAWTLESYERAKMERRLLLGIR